MFLNIKTEHCFLQSLCKIDELMKFGEEKNIQHLGIVEETFLIDPNKFILQCKKRKIKPIIGVRKQIINFYNVKYITIYAKDAQGILKLNELPKVIENISNVNDEHLHLVFNCKNMIQNQSEKSIESIVRQIKSNGLQMNLLNYSFSYDEKLILQTDDTFILNNMIYNEEIRYLKEEEVDYFTVLSSINKKTSYPEEKKYKGKYKGLSFENKIKKIEHLNPKVINNTKNFIDKIKEYKIEHNYKEVLDFEIFRNIDFKNLLTEKLNEYFKREEFNPDLKSTYIKRLTTEVEVIQKMEYKNYFLIMEDIINYLNKNNIKYGYGRGSAAGSLVSFLLKITKIDPIEYDLYFERFLNIKRSALPDIDLDISDVNRQEVIAYLINKYGSHKVAKIYTLNKYLVKSAFNDIAKALDFDKNLIKKINSNLSSYKTFEENIQDNYKFFGKYESDAKFDFLRESIKKIEGLAKNISIHAAGVIISNININKVAHIEDNTVYSEAKSLESIGFIKFDLLALSTLSFLNRLELKIEEIDPKYISDEIPLNYDPAYKALTEAKTLGVFQMESEGIKSVLKKYKPQSILDIAIVISMYRPGPMKNIDLLISNKENPDKIKYIHKNIKEILEQTYGIIVFQEQIMEIVKKVASFTNAEADIFRVAISKKRLKDMEKIKEEFLIGGEKNGYKIHTLNELYKNIEMFAGYGFNKAHAVSYARIIYQIMYIKTKYPTIFFDEMFQTNINSTQKDKFLLEIEMSGVKILSPQIEYLKLNNTLKRGTIIIGLNILKNIRKEKIKELIKKDQELEFSKLNIVDVFEKLIIPLDLTEEEKKSLIGSGIFDEFNINRKSLLKTLLKYSNLDLNILKLTKEQIKIQNSSDFSFQENSKLERESLGFNLKFSSQDYLYKKMQKKYIGSELFKISFELKNMEINKNYFLMGNITGIREISTKENQKMAFLSFKDGMKEVDIVIFTDNYLKHKEILKEKINDDIIIKVKKNKRENLVFEDLIS